jgi:hypothetical protein
MKMFVTSLALCGTAVFLYLIAGAQWECSIIPGTGRPCHGSGFEAWVFPFFFSVIGIPSVLWLLVIASLEAVKGIRAKGEAHGGSRAEIEGRKPAGDITDAGK